MTKFVTRFDVLRAPAGEGGDAGGGDMYGGAGSDAGAGAGTVSAGAGGSGGTPGQGKSSGQDDGQGDQGQQGAGDDGSGEGEGDEDEHKDLTEAERELYGVGKKKEGEDGDKDKQTKTPPAPASTTLKLDPETIKAIRGDKGEQGQKGMSPEEIQKLINPVVVSPDMLKGLGFENPTEDQVKGFQGFANAVVKNAVSLARVMIQQESKRFEEALTPISTHMQEQQSRGVRETFFKTFPTLTKYEEIVNTAAAKVSPTNADGSQKTRDQIFKEVAATSISLLRSLGINPTGKPSQDANHGTGHGEDFRRQPNAFPGSGRSGGQGNAGGKSNPDADIYSGR